MDGSVERQSLHDSTAHSTEYGQVLSSLGSFQSVFPLYRRTAHSNLTHRRRLQFHALPESQRSLLSAPPISYPQTLSRLDDAIEHNAELAETILRHSVDAFGVDATELRGHEWLDSVSSEDLDKVRSTLKQFYRDWSAEGSKEREVCYGPVMQELEKRFGQLSKEEKAKITVLIPGAGLGRLTCDIAVKGYRAEGNENSFHQLMASNYILNCTETAKQHTLYPFIHTFSNHRTRQNQLCSVAVPDIYPAALLSAAAEEDRCNMAAGDFVSAYNTPQSKGSFNVVATVFFIDTAINIFSYLETIWNALVDGGVWINYGPLLWHWENREADLKLTGETAQGMELTVDEVLHVAESLGFKLEKRQRGEKGEYIGSGEDSMLSWIYESEFWVAVKVPKDI